MGMWAWGGSGLMGGGCGEVGYMGHGEGAVVWQVGQGVAVG
jgi:hypothetical protein